MSRLVGTVHFKSTIDGSRMPQDAQRIGKEAGLAGGKGFNEQWDKELRNGLTKQGQKTLDHWKRRGSLDGLTYGSGLEAEFRKLSTKLSDAFKDFQGISVDTGFMDEWSEKSANWERDIDGLNESLALLHRQGGITDYQFRQASETVDSWAKSQREASVQAELNRVSMQRQEEAMRGLRSELEQHARARQNVIDVEDRHRRSLVSLNSEWSRTRGISDDVSDSFERLFQKSDGLSLKWSDLSHNGRQWTLIIGAITAALPELAGLSSAAGSGLVVLGGAATGAAVGIGTTISAIIGLNKDLSKLPPALLPARAGLDDFKQSFSDLNETIIESAFLNSEQSWRSLGSTVRGLAPDFAVVGNSIGDLLDDLANGLRPGTVRFKELSTVVRESAGQFDSAARSAGKFGDGLLGAFANPEMQRSVSELLGWIDELATSFDDFARGDSFDDWIRHGRAVFGEMGDLLNTTGRLLNDLVNPASINNLTSFLDSIGSFLDTGGRGILQFADALNAFGLVADALATIGAALEPLREPVVELGEELNRILTGAIEGLGVGLDVLAGAVKPVVEGLTDLARAVPTEVITALAGAATIAAGAFLALKGVQGIQGVVMSLQGISSEGGKATSALGKVGRAAGLIGGSVVGVLALASALDDLHRQVTGIDDAARNAFATNASLSTSYKDLSTSVFGANEGLTDISGALDQLASVGTGPADFFGTFAATFSSTGRQASQLAVTLGELDGPIANLANTSVSAASDRFSAWVKELNATDSQAQNMLNSLPQFKQVLADVAAQTAQGATDQNILALALGRTTTETKGNTTELVALAGQAGLTRSQVDNLANAIRGFGDQSLSARDADRQFQAALDDLTSSVAENGTSLDINTEQGRANEAALDQIASSAIAAAAAKVQLTGDENDATAAIQQGREALIQQLAQFGIVGAEAEAYADKLGLIPSEISTLVTADTSAARWAVDDFIDSNDGRQIRVRITATGDTAYLGDNVAKFASGGTLMGPRHILAGEAGPEAIVPLNRALSQVDPSVRWLSAIAQGKTPAMASGGVVGGGNQVTFAAGAIVVQGAADPRRTALDVTDEIAERISS